MNKQQLQTVREAFSSFLSGDTQILADEAFCNAVRSYYEVSPLSLSLSFSHSYIRMLGDVRHL